MFQVRNLKFSVIISIVLLINNTCALKCWRCSSDATKANYCGEILDETQISEQLKKWIYIDCNSELKAELKINPNSVQKCKIEKQQVNNQTIYSRSCSWEAENVPANSCTIEKNVSYVKTIACNTCVEDGCNNKLPDISQENSAAFVVMSKTVFLVFVVRLLYGL